MYRGTRGWTQGELADRLTKKGIPLAQQTIAKVEAGARPLRLSEAAVLSDVLGVEIGDLFTTASGVSRLLADHLYRATRDALDELSTAVWDYENSRVNAAAAVARVELSGDPLVEEVARIKRFLMHRSFDYELEARQHIDNALALLPRDERGEARRILGMDGES